MIRTLPIIITFYLLTLSCESKKQLEFHETCSFELDSLLGFIQNDAIDSTTILSLDIKKRAPVSFFNPLEATLSNGYVRYKCSKDLFIYTEEKENVDYCNVVKRKFTEFINHGVCSKQHNNGYFSYIIAFEYSNAILLPESLVPSKFVIDSDSINKSQGQESFIFLRALYFFDSNSINPTISKLEMSYNIHKVSPLLYCYFLNVNGPFFLYDAMVKISNLN
jgi:hypothetical protein